jgi:S-adenosylmethionine-diacylglycerol 3-amino-3-carboxypropyl transferase
MTMGSPSATPTVRTQLGGAVQQNSAFSVTGVLERAFAQTFTGLVYPQIWEDPVVDMDALEIGPDDAIVAIASGGCNVMSYLTANPASVEAVDLSPAHVALNRLKYAAPRLLPDHAAFFQLFGRAEVAGNAALFDDYLAPHLDVETVDHWNGRKGIVGRRIEMFEQGFYRFGALGLFIGWAHRIARLKGIDFSRFMACRDIEEQTRFFEDKVKPAIDSRFIKWVTRNRASLFGLGIPPQQYEALAGAADGDMHAVLTERTRTLMCGFPLSENYFAWAAFNRGYDPSGEGPLPPYLQRDNFETVRANAHKASIRNRTLTDFLRSQPGASKDCYVLLDAQDWMTDTQLNDLWAQITRTARAGARVIFRTAGVETILPGRVSDSVLGRWRYHEERSRKLHDRDRSAIYGGFHLYTLEG